MNDKEALKIFEACVNEMYKKSTPSTSLSEQDYNQIKDKYCKKLNLYYQRKLDWFLLDYAPSFKKTCKLILTDLNSTYCIVLSMICRGFGR